MGGGDKRIAFLKSRKYIVDGSRILERKVKRS